MKECRGLRRRETDCVCWLGITPAERDERPHECRVTGCRNRNTDLVDVTFECIFMYSPISHISTVTGYFPLASTFLDWAELTAVRHTQKKTTLSFLRPCINQIAAEPNTTFTTLFYRPLMNKPQSLVTWLNFSHFFIYFLWPRRLSIFHQPQYFAEWPKSIPLLSPLINKWTKPRKIIAVAKERSEEKARRGVKILLTSGHGRRGGVGAINVNCLHWKSLKSSCSTLVSTWISH